MTEDRKRFKNASGARYTRGLFYETTENPESALYTLKEYDHEIHGVKYPSLRKLYMGASDTTEYDFANKYLDGYSHWKQLTECVWFKPILESWREELRLKLESEYLREIREVAKEGGRDKYTANRTLLDRVIKPVQRVKKGGGHHPSGDEAKSLSDALIESSAISTHFDRIITNGKEIKDV